MKRIYDNFAKLEKEWGWNDRLKVLGPQPPTGCETTVTYNSITEFVDDAIKATAEDYDSISLKGRSQWRDVIEGSVGRWSRDPAQVEERRQLLLEGKEYRLKKLDENITDIYATFMNIVNARGAANKRNARKGLPLLVMPRVSLRVCDTRWYVLVHTTSNEPVVCFGWFKVQRYQGEIDRKGVLGGAID